MRRIHLGIQAAFVAVLVAVLATAGVYAQQTTAPTANRLGARSNPAAGSQATASAAAIANFKHVADCVAFAGGSTTAPALTALSVNLRDGATGAGTVLWSQQVVVSAATGQNVAPFAVCGLNLPGTANTAMTLEFSASLANLSESVALTYYDVNTAGQ